MLKFVKVISPGTSIQVRPNIKLLTFEGQGTKSRTTPSLFRVTRDLHIKLYQKWAACTMFTKQILSNINKYMHILFQVQSMWCWNRLSQSCSFVLYFPSPSVMMSQGQRGNLSSHLQTTKRITLLRTKPLIQLLPFNKCYRLLWPMWKHDAF